jgi:HEAT repeat protein
LQPEISDHHAKVVPLLITALGDESENVRSKSCYSVEAFCQHLGKTKSKNKTKQLKHKNLKNRRSY